MKKRSALAALALGQLLLTAGCWDRVEVNDMALVIATGLDEAAGGKLRLSVQIFVPKQGGGSETVGGNDSAGGGSAQTIVKEATGDSIADAVSRLQTTLSRRLSWEHNEVFIFGEKRLARGIEDDMDYLLRSRQTRERANLFVSQGEAIEALRLDPDLERDAAETLREMAKMQIGLNVTMFELLSMLRSAGHAAVLPYIQKLPEQPDEKQDYTVPYITGSVVLKNGRSVGRLDMKQTRGLIYMRGETDDATVSFKLPGKPGSVSLLLVHSKTELKPSVRKGEWRVRAKIDNEAVVLQNTTGGIVTDERWVREIERAASQSIEERIEEMAKMSQRRFGADIFQLSELFRKHYPRQWKAVRSDWDRVYREIKIEPDVRTRIRRPGISNTSLPL